MNLPRPKITPLKTFEVNAITSFLWQTRKLGPNQTLADFLEGKVVEDIISEGVDPEYTNSVRAYLQKYKNNVVE